LKLFYARPLTGTGKTAMRVNSDFDERRERIRQRVRTHIDNAGGVQRPTGASLVQHWSDAALGGDFLEKD
jgi:hypothetical protein